MEQSGESAKPVERLIPFVLRSGILVVGREELARRRKRLQFILVTTDLSVGSLREVFDGFAGVPVIERYDSEKLELLFGLKGTKILGFVKSSLAASLLSEWKEFRIQSPPQGPPPEN